MAKSSKAKNQSPARDAHEHLLDRGLPASMEAERAILGAILLDNTAYYGGTAHGLRTEHFSLDSHRRIFAAMEILAAEAKAVDFVTLTEKLAQHKEVEAVGGVAYCTSLTDGLPRVKNIDQYIDIVVERYQYRQIIYICTSLIQSAYEQSDTSKDLLSIAQDKLAMILGNEQKAKGQRIGEFIGEVYEDLKQLSLSSREILGLTTGVEGLDVATTGIRPGEYWIFGGFTSSGKSSIAGQSATVNALQGTPVFYSTIEMQKEVMAHRTWSFLSDVAYSKFRFPKHLRNMDFEKMESVMPLLQTMPLYIDDAELDLGELIARMHAAVRLHKIKGAYVDYLQLVNAPAATSRAERVSLVSRSLRSFAKTTGVPTVAVSQLTRPDKADVNLRPNKHMLKESGDVENDAHAIVLTYMPVDKETNEPTGDDELIIAKQRAGPIGVEKVQYDKQTLTFRARNWRDQMDKEEKQMTLGAGEPKK